MTVVASYIYRGGKRGEELPLGEQPYEQNDGEFAWIGVTDPTPEEMNSLKAMFGLHPLAIEDALNGRQVPKMDVYGDQLFVVAKTAHLEGDKIVYGETCIFVGSHHVVSVRHGSARAHKELREQLEQSPNLLNHGPDYVLHAIIDFIVDGYLPMVEKMEDSVFAMEQHMLISFNQAHLPHAPPGHTVPAGAWSDGEVVGKLSHLELPCVDDNAKPYFRDVLDHVKRVETMMAGLRDVITSVFEASNLLEQQRQGTITRQLAAWAAILAVPTAIAGIYGMNFQHMPELDTRYGYFVVLGAIVVLCSVLFYRFKRSGWL